MSASASTGSPSNKSVAEQLFDAMDRQALRLIEVLEDERKGDDGEPLVDPQTKMALFKMGQEWLMKRHKLRPDRDDDSEGDGVKDMRQWMSGPEGAKALEQTILDMGFVKVPPKKNGRPTKAEAAVRERYKEYKDSAMAAVDKDDDSGWQKSLGGE